MVKAKALRPKFRILNKWFSDVLEYKLIATYYRSVVLQGQRSTQSGIGEGRIFVS